MSTPDPNTRISNAEREAVIGRLHDATEEGRLDLDEFAERSSKVYEAKTLAEVERLLADLPKETGALAVPTEPDAAPELTLAPRHTSLKRDGPWAVPARIVVRPHHTPITLDCRRATFTSRDVEIDLDLKYSRLKLILPEGASAIDYGVELDGGRVRNKCRETAGDGPRFRLVGRVHFARVTIRYERRFLWWRW